MLLLDAIKLLRSKLAPKYGHGESEAIIRLIFHYLKNWSAVDLIINESKPLSPFVISELESILARLMANEPIQYIVGQGYFYGMDFIVKPGVLVPRQETEELVDLIVGANKEPDLDVLDVGTGSGAIAIALARNLLFPRITAIDNSAVAIDVAEQNASRLHAGVRFLNADVFNFMPEPSSLDIIVSNPPYVNRSEMDSMEPNVVDYEPHEAIFVSDDNPLRYYRRISSIGVTALRPGGRVYFEINPRHVADLRELLTNDGYENINVSLDVHGKQRFMSACRPVADPD